MNKPVNPLRFKTSLLAVLLTGALGAMGAPEAQAAGLGKLTVYSGIGQPLNAEVALTATPAELNSLSAKLASHEAFREAGIDYMSALSGMRFSIVRQPNNQSILKLTTDRPVNEPFLHFLVELNWSAGRMLREYTFLLDPPEMLQAAKAASVVAPVTPLVAPLPPGQPAAQAQPAEQVPQQARPTSPDTAKPRPAMPAAGEYQVRSGDSLGKIARATKPESVSLDQMLVALFNDNREAFDGNNMNRLRAGKILRVPGADEAAKVDPAEARKLVIGQAGEFNAYRRHLADAAVTAVPADAAPRQQVSGAIKPQVEDKTPPAPKQDKLEVSRTEQAKSAKPGGGGSLEEDLIARDKALREAAERIALLEKNIDNLKQLVEIKSQAGTKLQLESQAVQPKPADKPSDSVPVVPPAPAEKPEEANKAAPASEPAPAKPAEPVAPAVEQPPAQKPAVPPPPPPPEPSFIEENPQLVFGGGGLIALLLGYLGYSSWRRRKQAEGAGENMLASLPETESPKPYAAAAASPAGAGFDSGEVSIQSDFSDGGVLTTQETVDPVAEADVLMAYGRDRQAEEILQEGLKRDPTRTAIHMKLLELYEKQGNVAQFETVANELHKLTSGSGPDWGRALSMAHALGLSGGVFLGAGAVAGVLEPEAPLDVVEPAVTGERPLVQADDMAAPPLSVAGEETLPSALAEAIAPLDFDLDLGATDGADVAAAMADQAVTAAGGDTSGGIDFDFDLGIPEPDLSPETAAQQPPEINADVANAAGLDFDLDLGSPAEVVTDALGREETDFARSASSQNVVDLTSDLTAFSAGGVAEGVGDLKIDFDLELDGAPAAAVPTATAPASEPQGLSANQPMDGTDMDFDFDLNDLQPEVVAGAEVSGQAAGEIDNSEAETKLELAQAYVEMGDLDGARELFNEVVNEGSSAQRAKAQARLDQLET